MKKFFLLIGFLFSSVSFALAPTWQIIPKETHITFEAIQNDAPVSGEFNHFSADIAYDPDQLKESYVKIIIDLASVSASYDQLVETLKGKDWFDVALFPKAVFVGKEFTKTNDKTYSVKGMLTLRDKTLPTTLNFTLEDYSKTHALIKGSTIIQRTAFGIGQGEWSDTKAIKDNVKINFIVGASRN